MVNTSWYLSSAPLSPCFHSHSDCGLRRGAHWCSQFNECCHLRIDLRETQSPGPQHDPPRPRSHPNSALSHTYRIHPCKPGCPYAALRLALAAFTALRLYSGSYTSPVTHNRCNNTASLRATATIAFFLRFLFPFFPLFSSFPTPHAFKSLSGAPCRMMQCAPCTRRLRSNRSPFLLIPNSGSLSPLSRCFRVSPKYGPTSRLCSNRCASSMVNM